jgi:hypothetical protein
MLDRTIQKELAAHFKDFAAESDFGVHSLMINYGFWVGWSSTEPAVKFDTEATEPFEPNSKSTAQRVKTDREDLPAPRTKELTVVFNFKKEDAGEGIIAVLYSIYPGGDIGELVGDITGREKVVFFDWDHPGEE